MAQIYSAAVGDSFNAITALETTFKALLEAAGGEAESQEQQSEEEGSES